MHVLRKLTAMVKVVGWASWLAGPLCVAWGWPVMGTGLLAIGVLGWVYER